MNLGPRTAQPAAIVAAQGPCANYTNFHKFNLEKLQTIKKGASYEAPVKMGYIP